MGRCTLQRLFSAFPGGPPGIGLLLLRTVAGATFAAQGILCLSLYPHLTGALLAAGILLTLTGVFILIGFLTPILGPLAALQCLSLAVFGNSLPWCLFDSKLVTIQATAILVALAFLGPGALSLDARLFGWKEIVIPAAPRKPEQ
jgi:uncharacterized membrane protein YphA (DoxX/SURF4 family)